MATILDSRNDSESGSDLVSVSEINGQRLEIYRDGTAKHLKEGKVLKTLSASKVKAYRDSAWHVEKE